MEQNRARGLHRLRGFDYHTARAYWITFSTHGRAGTLGQVHEGVVVLSDAGRVVEAHIQRLSELVPVSVDALVIMPNHVHMILILLPKSELPLEDKSQTSVSDVIRSFKTYTAAEINRRRRTPGRPVWQRNYYERIIRDEHELGRFRQYITDNPRNWQDSHDDSAGPEDNQSAGWKPALP